MQSPAALAAKAEAQLVRDTIAKLENKLRDYRISLLATQGAQSRSYFLQAEIGRIQAEMARLPALQAELPSALAQAQRYGEFHAKTYGPCIQHLHWSGSSRYEPQAVTDIKSELRSLKHPAAPKAAGTSRNANSKGMGGGGRKKGREGILE